MPVIGIRELSRETADVIKELQSSGEPVVITKQGKPVATLMAVDEAEAQNLVLSLAPEIRETSSTAEVQAAPRKTRSLEEVSEQLVEEASHSAEGRAALEEYGSDPMEQRLEVATEVDRLFAEGSARLAGVTPALVSAWNVSAKMLVEGAVQAALDSARTLRESIEAPARIAAPPARKVRASAPKSASKAGSGKGKGGRQGKRAPAKA
jgi:prevent-host-death family protein